ncbi:MAG: phage portal protein [Candidatus Cloacimonetes bacterium]|nr:phage portal protein [Candidatus Cloacimonadota bacterium]
MFEFLQFGSETDRINKIINEGAATRITDTRFIELEIKNFKNSKRRMDMITGERYYDGKHDILLRKRTIIGQNGELEEVKNIPNNRIVDNQYAKMVDQKNNYLLGQPIVFKTDNEAYGKLLKKIFNKRFQKLMKNIGEDAMNDAIAWIYPYYNEQGVFSFKRFKPYEIIPGWADAEHTILDYVIRLFEVTAYEGETEKVIERVEVYTEKGINRFILDGGHLVPDEEPFSTYFTTIDEDGDQVIEQGWNWSKIPLIPFKYNDKEIPLIKKVKTLQDGLNTILSNFQNNMEEDARNTILVLMNYDGTNLGEFRKNLAQFGAVKVKTVDGAAGDLKTLSVEVNADNYKSILEIFKKAIIENAKGYDAKDDRMSGNPNQMNIQSMYSDIDLDANGMETEFQASFEDLLWFVNMHLFNAGFGDFEQEEVEVIFNRDILINETEVIDNCSKSVGILSDETITSMHPWVDDPQKELERKEEQKQKEQDEYANAFPQPAVPGTDPAAKGGVIVEK